MGLLEQVKRLRSGVFREVTAELGNQTQVFDQRLQQVAGGLDNQTQLFNQRLQEVVGGLANQTQLFNQRLLEVVAGLDNQSRILNEKLSAILELQKQQTTLLQALASEKPAAPGLADTSSVQSPPQPSLEAAMSHLPLLIDEKTYNTSHPDYDATLVRNFPGQIFNSDKPCRNQAYLELRKLNCGGDKIPDHAWDKVLADTLAEAKSVPHAEQVFERQAFIKQYVENITSKYQAHYSAGWVNLEDALFLYWLVRKLRPKTIVQTGVCNGLSSAFMMLGLAKNGAEGSLHVIDLPPVFDSRDPAWRVKGKVYGVVIPEGKSSGWIVPDAYRDRFEVWNGDAKALLPKMIDKVGSIDLFYHDSDHTYNHMMFEFREAKRKLNAGGLIVGDDVSWNASVWDFADQCGVPSYNFKGAVGIAFF